MLARGGEARLAVGADILEEQVAESDSVDGGQGRDRERLGHARLVDIVAAGWRDNDLDERDAERLGLPDEELAADAVHADPLIRLGDGRDQRLRLELPPAQCPKGERRVLAAAPGEGHFPHGLHETEPMTDTRGSSRLR